MNSKILVVGFACLSVVAVAQSSGSKDQAPKTSQVSTPRDAASGQASGKRSNKAENSTAPAVATPRDAQSGMATGKKTAHDDWHPSVTSSDQGANSRVTKGDVNGDGRAEVTASPSSGSSQTRVSAADLDGDGKADAAAAPQNSGHVQNAVINNSHSNIKSPRDVSTGQSSGKRQHEDRRVIKEYGKDDPKK